MIHGWYIIHDAQSMTNDKAYILNATWCMMHATLCMTHAEECIIRSTWCMLHEKVLWYYHYNWQLALTYNTADNETKGNIHGPVRNISIPLCQKSKGLIASSRNIRSIDLLRCLKSSPTPKTKEEQHDFCSLSKENLQLYVRYRQKNKRRKRDLYLW